MLRNYFKVALRNLLAHRLYTILNLSGLTLGLATCLFVFIYVKDELSYDKHWQHSERTYRLSFHGLLNGTPLDQANSSKALAETMVQELPEVEAATRLRNVGNFVLANGERSFNVPTELVSYADSNITDIFSLHMVSGQASTGLKAKNTLFLSKSMASKLFGEEDPLQKTLLVDGRTNYTVTGVYEDMPDNSHFRQDALLSMATYTDNNSKWLSFNYLTYVRLQPGTDPAPTAQKLNQLLRKHIGVELQRLVGVDYDGFEKAGNRFRFDLQPLLAIHLNTPPGQGHLVDRLGNKDNVLILAGVGAFVLLLACINFMNISTARSSRRSKEVGIRKTLGSQRSQLILQFMAESTLFSIISAVLAVSLVELLLPVFNAFTHKQIPAFILADPAVLVGLFVLILFIGVFAGSYPAFFLSGFKPVVVLKGKLKVGAGSLYIRQGLVVFQFAVSTTLILGTLVIYQQLRYTQQRNLGYNREQVLVVDNSWMLRDKQEAFRDALSAIPAIEAASYTSSLPIKASRDSEGYWVEGETIADIKVMVEWESDTQLDKVLGLQLASGRWFEAGRSADTLNILLNEEAVRVYKLGPNPIGKKVYQGTDRSDSAVAKTVIGIVKDFHYASLKEPIGPVLFRLGNRLGYLPLRVKTTDLPGTIANLKKTWEATVPGTPFEYFFLDDRFNDLYQQEAQISTLVNILAGLAIFVACLGLFGLSAFTAEQRTKEIGLRKVMGASEGQIVRLLSRQFLRLVLLAMVIALPLGYLLMDRWLQDFVYHTTIGAGLLVLSALLALAVAFGTMSYQSIRAARSNPVDALRYE